MTATPALEPALPPRERFTGFARTIGGIAAIGVKELRGRMRGRRAFAILTIYLLLLGGFALMVETIIEAGYSNSFGGGGTSAFASASIGQGIFAALLFLMTLQVVFLASSSTAGAISLEREKQTLELLIATPISSLAIIIGKLLSALVYVFLLIAASVPLMAVVFVYGGIGPEDVLRGYIVLTAAALGLGSFGLLCSSLVKRTTAATAITIFGVLAITVGTVFILVFWQAMSAFDNNGNRQAGPLGIRSPVILAYLNPFIAQADVMCGTEASFGGGWCSAVSALAPSTDGIVFRDQPTDGGLVPGITRPDFVDPAIMGEGKDGVIVVDDQVVGRAEPAVGVAPNQPFGAQRDALWPKSVLTWLILSVVFVFLSVQAVSPTRRWRPRRRQRVARSATE
jgi:ABC-type transport system involved in multi-copper enzyme maturation permease subunit